MPILIKSSNGKRTCTLVTKDNSNKEAFTPEDIIAALRGLTLKVEMKIVDVMLPESTQEAQVLTNTNAATSGPVSEPTQPEPRPEPKPMPVSKPATSPNATTANIPDNLVPTQVLRAKVIDNQPATAPKNPTAKLADDPLHIAHQSRPVETVRVEDQPEPLAKAAPACTNMDRIVTPAVTSAKVEPKPVEPEKTKLIKGSLKVGSTIKAYCLAVEQTEPPIVYIPYDTDKIHRIGEMISELAHDIENLPPLESPRVGDIVLGKSNDDNSWYRAIVESVEGSHADVFFFDWGLKEKLSNERLKRLSFQELGLSECPACALKLTFKDSKQELIDETLTCEVIFDARVDSYDFASECYEAAILKTDTPA